MTPLRSLRSTALAIAFLPLGLGAQASTSQEPVTAFVDVSVVPLDRDGVVERQTVVVRGEKIVSVGPTARTQVPAGATRIDGRGKFLMPGLAEMHAHVVGPQNPNHETVNRDIMFLYVANGITSIRAMLGAPNQLPLREALRKGEILGPTMYVSAPSLNGNSAPNPDSGAKLVRAHKAAGYDFLKIHPGLSRATYDAIVSTANEVGLTWAGHVPPAVGLHRAIEVKQSGVDHLDGILEAATPADMQQRMLAGPVPLEEWVAAVDPARFPGIVGHMKDAGMWHVPTILIWENLYNHAEAPEALGAREEMKYWPRQAVANMVTQKRNQVAGQQQNGITPEVAARYLALRRQALKAVADANSHLMMGTDSPQLFMVPGFAMHREIGIIQQAGLTPQKIYESGARNVATYVREVLKQDGNFGTVVAGNRADLVLLDANPLQNVENLKKRSGVMVKGRWVSAAEIDRGLAELAARFAQ
jgi:imidazolonepropionase-like amidohydrolase